MTIWLKQSGVNSLLKGLLVVLFLLPVACERQPETIKVGMVASLTGRTGDIGLAARDGVLFAIEQANNSGGVQGQPVDLLIRDIENDPDKARLAVKELSSLGVYVTVGPVLSSMAVAIVPYTDELNMLLVSPTVTTNQLSGKDDLFLRVTSQCSNTSSELANFIYKNQLKRVAVIAEQSNKAYTESWENCFRHRFEDLGGEVAPTIKYNSGKGQGFTNLTLKALQANPDSLLILGNAIDSAMIAQQVEKIGADLKIFVSEWSFTDELITHGGRSVEGIVFLHSYNVQSQSRRFLSFVKAFEQRFGRKPSFAEVHAYDATKLVLVGLQKGARSGRALKQELLQIENFEALQTPLRMDRYGDVERKLFLTSVRNGEFVVLNEQEN